MLSLTELRDGSTKGLTQPSLWRSSRTVIIPNDRQILHYFRFSAVLWTEIAEQLSTDPSAETVFQKFSDYLELFIRDILLEFHTHHQPHSHFR